jgi:penicillin-binding protein 2
LGSEPGEDGKDLHLTIDGNLQKVAFDVLQKHSQQVDSKKAAAVIQNPNTGEVLALVSLPSFDPGQVDKYLQDKDEPFFNRAIQGVYPPGSIFKIVSALAGLESGAITQETEIEDVGEFYLGDTRFVNWFYLSYGGRDGKLKIERAIARSNDIFFYRLAEKTGLDSLREMAKKLGLGQKTGIDLPYESVGLVPDETWKKSTYGQDWYLGDTLHFGIGQGFVLATPLQMNTITSFMASGKLTRPYLVRQIGNGDGNSIKMEGKILTDSLVGEQNFQLVRQGMKQACEKGGTGWPFFNAPYKVGCKTGTAERALGDPHAWFTVFTPYEKPEISVTVIIENGGEGSSVAGPVAREILDWWFANKVKS